MLLDATQAQFLYDNASKRVKLDVDGIFYTWRIIGVLLGFEYTFDSKLEGSALDGDSDTIDVQNEALAHFQTLTFKGSEPIGKETKF